MRHINIIEIFKSIIQKRDESVVLEKPAPEKASPAGQSPAKTGGDPIGTGGAGHLEIPEGTAEIPDCRFDRLIRRDMQEPLVSVSVPGTVRRIGSRAFGNCAELEEVILCEGIECIENNAFTGCAKLKKIRLPRSLSQIDGGAFYRSGIEEPVISADGKTLIYYPQAWDKAEYSIPDGIEEIAPRAFIDQKQLMKVNLPGSMKRICSKAFYDCGFRELAVPAEIEIEDKAFAFFKHTVRILREKALEPLEEKMEQCRINGISFLRRQRMAPPADPYWKAAAFRSLAEKCASGDVQAMERMEEFFLNKGQEAPEAAFYRCAAQFWLVRAFMYGSERAKARLSQWCAENPDSYMCSPCIDEHLLGSADGAALNALGFLFFDGDREYSLGGLDGDGVVEVSSWESEEGPDSDGYGREEYYDWWYLDGHLNLPDGVGYIHSYSHNDKRCNEEKFRDLHDRAAGRSSGG